MARLALNKSSLAREKSNLAMYKRFLPALDLKRQQLMAERAKAENRLAQSRRDLDDLIRQVGEAVPMLSNRGMPVEGLVTLKVARIGVENVVGTKLPQLESIEVDVAPYGYLVKPHWVDRTVQLLHDALELRVRIQIDEHRLELLEKAVRTITQRVNLFDKVLIPRSQSNMKKIQVYLSDAQTAAVVRSKISKKKQEARRAS